MKPRSVIRVAAVLAVGAVLAALLVARSVAAPAASRSSGRYLVVARSAADLSGLRAKAIREGAKVIHSMPQIKAMAIQGTDSARSSLAADGRTVGVARDRLQKITPTERNAFKLSAPGLRSATRVPVGAQATAQAATGINPDPAWDYKGLLWDYRRIGLPRGWRTTAGSSAVTVGVADTGLDFTHQELSSKVKAVVDFTGLENPPVCKTFFGRSDADLAARFGGPEKTDWNGHGSWIGGNIAAARGGTGTNGIAPRVGLVALKISQWCGSTFDSTILAAFVAAADLGLDVVSISFGGYKDRSDPEQELAYQMLVDAVRYARGKGTLIVASAGNEHLRIGAGGRVLSHGPATAPGDPFVDRFGQYETPGGIPGVVDVSATNNVVVPSSASCPPRTIGDRDNLNATCKPASDPHQATGQGRRNQLAYYSNYGPRIDLAAPGGARKFNLPFWDRGGTPRFPFTSDDLTNAWQTFSTTSNWAVEIPCFVFTKGSGFPPGQCYSTIQGTSMATPHVSAAVALTASAHPSLRHRPAALVARLKARANTNVHNLTQVLSASDTSPGELDPDPCTAGYCHLGGPRISDSDAYGAGLVNIANP